VTVLDRLAALARGEAPTLRARVPARFEPAATDGPAAFDAEFADADGGWGEIDAERDAVRPAPHGRGTPPTRPPVPRRDDRPGGAPGPDDRIAEVGRRPAADRRPTPAPERHDDEAQAPSVPRASPAPPTGPPSLDPARRPEPVEHRADGGSATEPRPVAPPAAAVTHPVVVPTVLRAVEPRADRDRDDHLGPDVPTAPPDAVDGNADPAPITVTIGHIEIRAVPASAPPAPVAPAPRRPRLEAGPDLASYLEGR